MTQIFNEEGSALPVTVIRVGPCLITQIKNLKTDGYNAVQIGYSKVKPKNIKKSQLCHFQKSGLPAFSHLCEYKNLEIQDYLLGQEITVDIFKMGQLVNVTGKSVGKGYSGNQKRHKFKRGPMTHGSKNHRAPGSIGPGTTPGRVFPGKLMSGQLGNKQITISKLEILGINLNENLLVLKGNVPGKPGNLLKVTLS
uniref:Large ribosomal subunit protein uL3c n=1 Tax=Dictyopteris divaricata TaxID=156996 RepID=A0A2I4Q2G8_9PHAE|nr:50S ribosomal protein L3 [Dictyopteris divaricata]YP_010205331.1 50S ribosomal protein L3 [Grateloupia livida]AQZ25042.1 50S ribosomal protein L3 [Dictyopteris divaricata]UAV85900.1 50S ribosomal protein L3 [Grateloupia livida]